MIVVMVLPITKLVMIQTVDELYQAWRQSYYLYIINIVINFNIIAWGFFRFIFDFSSLIFFGVSNTVISNVRTSVRMSV